MDLVTRRLLLSFEWRPVLILILLTLGTLYTLGWFRLRHKAGSPTLTPVWKLVAYLTAIITVLIALLSFIDILGGSLFYMHMIQHLMLTMIAGPLIMLADPLPIIMWGLPRPLRKRFGKLVLRVTHKKAAGRKILRAVTTPGVSYVVMLVLLWGWHEPRLYNLAIVDPFVHDLEHIAFLFSSLIYWWHVTGAGPRIHPKMAIGRRIGYLFAGVPSTFLPGVAITFSNRVLYTAYETAPPAPPPFFVSIMNDQILGGIIMWVPGSMMFFVAAFVLIGRWLTAEQERSRVAKMQWMANQAATSNSVVSDR